MKCPTKWCGREFPEELFQGPLCPKCEDLMYDARCEAAAEKEEREEFGD